MKASEVYRKAAKIVFNNWELHSCCAISSAKHGILKYAGGLGTWRCKERDDYSLLFAPDLDVMQGRWASEYDWGKNERLIALLLMSEIAKDEERK